MTAKKKRARNPEGGAKAFPVGVFVKLHPATSYWMQGDQHGQVVAHVRGKPDVVRVMLDRSGRVVSLHVRNVEHANPSRVKRPKNKPISRARASAPAARNPSAPRGELMSSRVLRVEYIHAADGKRYYHDFKPGVSLRVLPDGSVRIVGAKGQRITREF